MTRQAGEYYLTSDDLVFTRSIRRIKVFKLFSSVVSSDCDCWLGCFKLKPLTHASVNI